MKELNYIDELTNYLKSGNKENFLKRYIEVINEVNSNSEEYVDLKLLKFTYGFLFVGDYEDLLNEIEVLEPIINKGSTTKQKIKFLVNKGIILGRLNQTDEAIRVYNIALECCNSEEIIPFKISILTNIGVIYFRKNKFVRALKHFLTAYDLNKKFNCQVKLTSLLVNIGVIYLHLDLYEKAIYYFELSLKTMTNSREYAKLSIYNNLITAYSVSGDFSNASKIIDLCIPEKAHFSKSDKVNFHKAKALFYSKQKEQAKAIDEYIFVINQLKGDKYTKERSGYQIALARIYSEIDELSLCKMIIDELDTVEQIDKKIASYNSFLELKVQYYTLKEDFENALKYSRELNEIHDEQFKSLEKEILSDLALPLSEMQSNISNDAYDDKINELEGANKELNEQTKLLLESLSDLKNESELREKLISIISHDIRAPIGNIILLLEMINDFEDENESEEVIAEVINSMKQAFALTDELVDWAKELIDAKKSTLSYINFKEIVSDVELLYKQQLQSKNIIVINNLSQEKVVFAHKTSLKTCFRNVIYNAIKYSEPYSKIEISEEINADSITCSIRDNGRGIAPRDLETLFDVSKISTLGTNEEKGIGIGLLLVKELVARNNGKISCESKVKEGTTFYLTFPISGDQELDIRNIVKNTD